MLCIQYYYHGEEADVTVIAGCGIHNSSSKRSQHDGIHEIIVKQGTKNEICRKTLW